MKTLIFILIVNDERSYRKTMMKITTNEKAQFEKDPKLLYSFVNSKCPRCRTGKIFETPAYTFKKEKLNKKCSHCDFRFEREVGYFHASMYVSYGLNVAEITATSIMISTFTSSEDPWLYIYIICTVIVLLFPMNLRLSKTILLYFMDGRSKYDRLLRIRNKEGKIL